MANAKRELDRQGTQGNLGEWMLFGVLLTAGACLIVMTTVAPHRSKTREFVDRAVVLEEQVIRLRQENALLERKIVALKRDPWMVERELRRRTGFLREGEHRMSDPGHVNSIGGDQGAESQEAGQ